MRKYYDTIILAESVKENYELLNNKYDGVTGSDVYSDLRKQKNMMKRKKEN